MNLALLSRLMAQPWAVRHDTLALFARLVMDGDPIRKRADTKPTRRARAGYIPCNDESCYACDDEILPEPPDGIPVIMPWGVLGRAWTDEERWCMDAVDVDGITSAIESTSEGSTVILWFRSPGGIITGIPETAAALRQLGKTRRLLAFTDDLCCSAAYWLAAQCESIHSTPTAATGSIGVYIAMYDFTEYLAKAGVELNLFKAGTMKGMGLKGNPLSDEEAALLQANVDESYRQFTADVTRNRAIAPETMQGQSLAGKSAAAANLIDATWPSAAAFFAAVAKGKV